MLTSRPDPPVLLIDDGKVKLVDPSGLAGIREEFVLDSARGRVDRVPRELRILVGGGPRGLLWRVHHVF